MAVLSQLTATEANPREASSSTVGWMEPVDQESPQMTR